MFSISVGVRLMDIKYKEVPDEFGFSERSKVYKEFSDSVNCKDAFRSYHALWVKEFVFNEFQKEYVSKRIKHSPNIIGSTTASPEKLYDMYEMRAVDRLTYREIGEKYGLSISRVSFHLQRIMCHFMNCFYRNDDFCKKYMSIKERVEFAGKECGAVGNHCKCKEKSQ